MSNFYIGLGGFGIDAVKAVFERNQGDEISCSKDEYLLIDTDTHSERDLPEVLQGSFIGIGEKTPTQTKEEALNSPQKEWFLNWYDYYDPSLEYKFSANAVAFFAELQTAIDSSDGIPSTYYPLVPQTEWMKDLPFVPFSCCCAFESNRMTKSQVCHNMVEVAYTLSRVNDSDIYWGMASSMSVATFHHLPEESLNVATLRRCSGIVDMDLAVDHLKRQKVCYMFRPGLKVPIEVLNLGNEDIIGFDTKEQTGVDVLSFHSFSFKDYAFYKQYRARSDGRWAYVDKKFARKVVDSALE